MFRRLAVIGVALLLAACNLSVPQVTPTVAPTRTPTETPPATNTPFPTIVALAATETATSTTTPSATPPPTATPTEIPSLTPTATFTAPPSNTPTATATFTATSTDAPTITPSATPTDTVTPSDTPTPTFTFTPTNTNAPTATHTPTPAPSNTPRPTATNTLPPTLTPLPLIPTNTPTATFTQPPTATPTPTATGTATPSATPTNTLTPLPTDTPAPPTITPLPTLTATRTLSAAEMTAIFQPTPSATRTMSAAEATIFFAPSPTPAPTLDVTPTFITAEAPPDITITPLQVDTTPQVAPTATPQPTVALIVTLAPTLAAPPSVPTFIPLNPQTRAFALDPSGVVVGTGFSLVNDVTLFARNPVNPNLYASTDTSGNLYLTGLNGADGYRPDMSPFSQFVAPTKDENNAYVSSLAWSPDGRFLAFIVNARSESDNGVWFFQPGAFPPVWLMGDCPTAGWKSCLNVENASDPTIWYSTALRWSPTNDALLVSIALPEENRTGFTIVPVVQAERLYTRRPPIFRYPFAAWSRDGQRILASGLAPDGRLTVEWLNRDGSSIGRVSDPAALGLWLGYANEAANAQLYALGAPGDTSGAREPLRIYTMNGQALTPPIGEGTVERVEWSPDGSQVFVQTGGRQFIATVSGSVREITGQVAGARAINWIEGVLPPSEELGVTGANPAEPPSGVIAGSQYSAGQQLRVLVQQLNIRSGPGVEYDIVRAPLLPGDYVAILAGPVTTADGVTWWRVQTADGVIGWIAGAINGTATLGL